MTPIATLRAPATKGGGRSKAPRTDRERLAEIIYKRSFGRGKIVLASGQESDFYFDMKPSMLDPEGARLMAKALLEEIRNAGADYVGGLEMGAVPITGAVCALSTEGGTRVSGFFVRKQAKVHGARKLVEGLVKGETLEGKRIVIVDDVTTTGQSAFKAIEPCLVLGAQVALVISVVDRGEGAEKFFESRGLKFKALFSASEFLARNQ